ncbi:MAG: hypothetical protein HKN36_09565 [Hellea sp.]|nr:hypothetical protein [Hellea sp.]
MQQDEEYLRPDPHADDELVPFDVQGYSNRKGLFMLAAFGLAVIFGLFFFFKVYQPGVRDRGETPKVMADKTPFKIAPDDPGGSIEPNQNLEIYNQMNGETSEPEVTVTESAEEPVKRPGTVKIDVIDQEKPKVTETQPVTTPKPTVTPKPVEVIPTTPGPSTATDSRHVVQLASLRSQSSAETTKTEIQAKHSNLFPTGSYLEIVRANVADKGVYYRLRLAGLPNKDGAQRICDLLKARQQTCFTTTK